MGFILAWVLSGIVMWTILLLVGTYILKYRFNSEPIEWIMGLWTFVILSPVAALLCVVSWHYNLDGVDDK